MSRSTKSGRGRGGGGGLRFDALLKACSNSKKPVANKSTGSLGRFGVASYSSVRSTDGDSGPSESRFSFSKKPKLSTPSPAMMQSPYMSSQSMYPSYGLSSMQEIIPTPVIPKPRKFFKSRDTEDSGNGTSGDMNSDVLESTLKIPVVKPAKPRGRPPNPDKSKPLRTANLSSSPPHAQPIKLRIFKDKATSKLKSEAPPAVAAGVGKGEKVPKKRGRKPKNQQPVALDIEFQQEASAAMPESPPKPAGRATRNSRKNEAALAPELMHPMSIHQQLHRNSDSSIESMPVLTRAHGESGYIENAAFSQSCAFASQTMNGDAENRISVTSMTYNQQPAAPVLPRKLEEDTEFQQLSQMLSSMEEDTGHAATYSSQLQQYYSGKESGSVPTAGGQHQFPSFGDHQQQQFVAHQQHQTGQMVQQQAISQPIQQYPYSSAYTEYHNSESMSSTDHRSVTSLPRSSSSPTNNEIAAGSKGDSRDIRAMLEDEWDESFDEESPKKSPPKTSRFDLSAFMPDASSGSQQESTSSSSPLPGAYSNPTMISQPHGPATAHTISGIISTEYSHSSYQQQLSQSQQALSYHQQMTNYSTSNQFVESSGLPHSHLQSSQQPASQHFNAPYAVRNLLSSPQSTDYNQGQGASSGDTASAYSATHPVPNAHESSHSSSIVKQDNIDKSVEALNLSTSCTAGSDSGALEHQLELPLSQDTSKSAAAAASKKGSIFKSRAHVKPDQEGLAVGNPKKRLALYKHKFGQGDDDSKTPGEQKPTTVVSQGPDEFDEDSDAEDLASMQRIAPGDYGEGGNGYKVLCKKNTKKLYSVIRNVKPMHELQESGEFHEFDGDVQYILEELNDKNPLINRCLSAITLATRCMEPSFRMHLRAHGTVAEFCKELHDAPTNPILALLASTVLFVLSQDRLNMDLDTDSLKLIIALTKAHAFDSALEDNPELVKLKTRVIDLVLEMKSRGHAAHLKVEKITASELALETMLYLTSKRAGDWMKHELRTLGGLDYIITEVMNLHTRLSYDLQYDGFSEVVIEGLWKVDRCLRVLHQVTLNHEENQKYLLGVPSKHSGEETTAVHGTPAIFTYLFGFCNNHISSLPPDSEPAKVLHELLFSILRVLVNLSHDYRGIVLGSEILCGMPEFLPLCLHSVFHTSQFMPDDKAFEQLMHTLCMLLNLVEYSRGNRAALLKSGVTLYNREGAPTGDQPALQALVSMFLAKERAAIQDEASTDNILTTGDSKKPDDEKSGSQSQNAQGSQDSDSPQDTIVDKLIQTAGKHMENTLIAAYIALLLAYLVMDNPEAATIVQSSMPDGRYLSLMVVLKKLFNFMSITSMAGSFRGLKAIATALKFYAKCDPKSNEELKKIIPD